MNHVMIDLETLGNGTRACIAQIGAVSFNPFAEMLPENQSMMNPGSDGHGATFFKTLNMESCRKAGLEIDVSTVLWWMGQNDPARKAMRDTEKMGSNIEIGLELFSTWYRWRNPAKVWSHGATFDIVILNEAFKLLGMPSPWGFRDAMDTRTIFWLAGGVPGSMWNKSCHQGSTGVGQGVAHHALDDAWAQARMVQWAIKELGINKIEDK